MAGRKRLWEQVADLPWWVGIVLAIFVYVFLRFIFPVGASSSVALRPLVQAVSQLAWLFAVPFVVAAIVSAVREFSRKRLLDEQVNLDSIRALSWHAFERLAAEAFSRQGYFVEERGGSAPDGGVDLELWKSGRKTLVQCKRWQTKRVGVNLVRELYGVMTAEGADEGIFVSSGDYTDDARQFADGKPIRLINGKALLKMIHEVQPAATRSEDTVPTCPKCTNPMVMRTTRSGPRAGKGFWGCSAFPQCRGTRPLS
jgi:restriction system protein